MQVDLRELFATLYPTTGAELERLRACLAECERTHGRKSWLGRDKFAEPYARFENSFRECVRALAADGHLPDTSHSTSMDQVDVALGRFVEAFLGGSYFDGELFWREWYHERRFPEDLSPRVSYHESGAPGGLSPRSASWDYSAFARRLAGAGPALISISEAARICGCSPEDLRNYADTTDRLPLWPISGEHYVVKTGLVNKLMMSAPTISRRKVD